MLLGLDKVHYNLLLQYYLDIFIFKQIAILYFQDIKYMQENFGYLIDIFSDI